eukprot:TRINITY_DN1310_c0_g1_i3.p1 TRINITY_DN1310_c0_g1~~TRINITY_DN1310_c0_g1_i3.p1  ORF type:complete len:484 (+),score=131.09 TRINITY_DN1310_c0_g1_i3:48-1454(+)
MKIAVALVVVLCLVGCATFVSSQPSGDLVTDLPNLSGTLWEQYSGYAVVNASHGRALHYWFFYSQSGTPEDDPVVLWLNGGPGCSSLDGLLYENGPYHFAGDENNITLVDNPYSWNVNANVIYLEAPAGVGFSYSNTSSDYATNDWQTANDNFEFLVWFFTNFPDLADNEFWISGESYAGVYVPTLGKVLYEQQLNGALPDLVFKGILVGNGVTDPYYDSPLVAEVPFVFGHALMGSQNYSQIQSACYPDNTTDECQNLLAAMYNVFNDIDIYNIIGDCFSQRPFLVNSQGLAADFFFEGSSSGSSSGSNINGPGLVPPCTDAYKGTIWLNYPEVKTALHVRQDITWGICSLDINANYSSNAGSMLPIHQELIKGNKQILIYSGDVDGAVPTPGTEAWTSALMGVNSATEYYVPWYYNDVEGVQVGGFKTVYEGLTFITIRGAGHMVPQYQPAAAFNFFNRWINGQPI